jgi:NAD(P)-dependent dehydrogenase (short-subunit alcohol dehydrogenase family)
MSSFSNDLFSLEGKTALLTGGGRGIGQAIASGLTKAGASVAIFEKNIEQNILPDKIKIYTVDLIKHIDLEQHFNDFINDFGAINILINNAGITKSSPSENYSENDWKTTLDINLSSFFLMCQLAGRKMIQQEIGGSIINVTSIGGSQGFPNNPAYCASKGGVRQLTKALALDWGKYGIRVNNLVPGYTHTPMNQKSWEDKNLRQERATHAMLGRWAEPEDMIGAAIFLASDASSYVTGSDLYVDGGWNAKGI